MTEKWTGQGVSGQFLEFDLEFDLELSADESILWYAQQHKVVNILAKLFKNQAINDREIGQDVSGQFLDFDLEV